MIVGPPGDGDDMPRDPFEDGDDGDGGHAERAEMEAAARAVQDRWSTSEIEEKLMALGLYVDQSSIVPIPTPDGKVIVGIAVLAQVNKVAFSARVLDPEQANMDKEFRKIDHSSKADDFLDARERMKRNIAAGRDPLDDGDE